MNKILLIGVACLFSLSASAQASWRWSMKPLLSGYNILVTSNGFVTLGNTNVLYTAYNGQILYAYSNNVNGGLSTNQISADAFQSTELSADVNADIVANAALVISFGNTNLTPIITTNLSGQIIVPNFNTNGLIGAVPWPLNSSGSGPNWSFGSTNYYPQFGGNGALSVTNQLFVSLYRMYDNPKGGIGPSPAGPSYRFTETTPGFTVALTVNNSGTIPTTVYTNLPLNFLQGARKVYCSLSLTNSTYTVGTNQTPLLVNQVSIQQPQP